MAVRKNILIAIGVVLISALTLLYVSSRLILLNGFARLEEQNVREEMQHALGELIENQENLNTMAVDYADWNDTYAFVAGELSDYPQVNLTDQTYQYLRLELVLIVNTAGQIVYGSGYDLEAGKPTPVPDNLLAHINPSDRLLAHSTIDSSLTGVVLLPEGPLVVASRPILTSDFKGPSRGTLIIGRYLSASEIDRLAHFVGQSITLRRFDDPQLPADFATARANLSPALPIFIQPLNADKIAGYSLVMDLYDQPALLLRIDMARTIYTQGYVILNYFMGWSVILGLVSSATLYIALDRLFLSRQAHQAAEAKYRSIFENAVEGIFQSTPDGCFISVNPAMARIYGYGSAWEMVESVTNIASQIYVDPGERDRATGLLQANGMVDAFEGQNYRKDGAVIWTSTSARAVRDGRGTLYYEGFIQDITKRKQAEEALRKSEEQHRLLFESNPLPMWVYDLETLRFLHVNDAAVEHYGYGKDEFLAMTLRDIRPPEELPRLEANLAEPRQRRERSGPWKHCKKNGTLIDVEIISHDIMFLDRPARLVLAHDITERKQAEQALRESEERNRAIVNAVPDLLFQVSRDGIILDYRTPDESALYAPPEAFLGKNVKDVLPPHVAQPSMEAIEESLRFNKMAMIEYELPMHGEQRFYEDRIVPLSRDRALSVIRDITERKRAVQKLDASEKRFRALIENIFEGIVVVDASGTIQYLSPSSSRVLGLSPEELIGQNAFGLIHPEDLEHVTGLFAQALQQPELRATASIRFRYADRTWRWVEAVGTNAFAEPSVQGMIVTVRDITERKRAEAELAKLHRAVESSGEVIFLTDREGTITYINPEFTNLYGYSATEVVGQTTPRILKSGLLTPDQYEGLWKILLSGQAYRGEWINKAKNGRLIEIEGSSSPIQDEDGNIIGFLAIQRDMTERKRAEAEIKRRLAELEAVNQLSTAMRAAQTLDQILHVFLDVTLGVMDTTVGSIWLYDPAQDEVRVAVTRGWVEGRSVPPEKPGEGIAGYVFASRQTLVERDFHLSPRLPEVARQQIPPGINGAAIPLRAADNVIGTFNISVLQPRELTPDEVHLLTILGEIAGNAIQRARLHEQTEQRLRKLGALHEIDTAINASLNLQLTLNVFVDQVIAQLGVDATAVSLLDPRTHMLEYMVGRGFRAPAIEQTRQRLGEGITGRAALDRRTIHIANLREAGKGLRRTALLIGEGFVAYYGVPLIAKGQVKGVLEIFQRAPLEPDAEWLDFLNVLAEQAAIAIDNATLFDSLQRSNAELAAAYDATIEGWSRALDLRDKETEGHTRRVTEMTAQLAHAFGLSDEALVQVRRGALLHDIGKMGIPDRILLKPGPLTDEEWVLMKMHPAFAYEMLSPIRYLRPAMDIPYCHHEKWDGTGYPRGLKGEQIPFAARIFAVVDVWDALRSDRPYRPGWPEDKVVEHLRSLSGTHFDPQVAQVFLNLLAGRHGGNT